MPALPVSAILLVGVLLFMLVELQLSRFNERALRAQGAVEPTGDIYEVMRIAYPAAFAAMAVEGAWHAGLQREMVLAGLLLFGWAKALKFWAIATLGTRWTFRVLVPPAAPLVTGGPYRFLRHPNYVAVMGEIAAFAIALEAPVAGTVAGLGFAWILFRRIRVEDHALGRG